MQSQANQAPPKPCFIDGYETATLPPEEILLQALQNPKLQKLLTQQADDDDDTMTPDSFDCDPNEWILLKKELRAAVDDRDSARRRRDKLLSEEKQGSGATQALEAQNAELRGCRQAVRQELAARRDASVQMIQNLQRTVNDLRLKIKNLENEDSILVEALTRCRLDIQAKKVRTKLEEAHRGLQNASILAEEAEMLLAESRQRAIAAAMPERIVLADIAELQTEVEARRQTEAELIEQTCVLRRTSELMDILCKVRAEAEENAPAQSVEKPMADIKQTAENADETLKGRSKDHSLSQRAFADRASAMEAKSRYSRAMLVKALAHISPIIASWVVSAWWMCSSSTDS